MFTCRNIKIRKIFSFNFSHVDIKGKCVGIDLRKDLQEEIIAVLYHYS